MAADLLGRLRAAGIGFAGIDGAWWRPARAPFPLPAETAQDLAAISRALFALFDAVAGLYGRDPAVTELLEHQVPAGLPRWVSPRPVLGLRPDFQLCPQADGRYQLMATELEMCPSAHGFAHAMQTAYGLEPDLARAGARFLAGREFWFVGAAEWSEFLIEQLAFCRALAEHGARGRVLYDRPLAAIAAEFRAGQRWQPPMFGVRQKPAGWDDDLLGRLRRAGLLEFAWDGAEWPAAAGEAVVFRFGYFDCFTPERLAHFPRWEAAGATPLNPATFYLDSKAVLAAARRPEVLERVAALDPAGPEVLGRCLPETVLLRTAELPRLLAERERWVLKFAGFDRGQQAWGGRSLQFGLAHPPAGWEAVLRRYLALPFPVVAQRLAPSAAVDIDYIDGAGQPQTLPAGATRLRAFFWRGQPPAGVHLTVSGGTMQVSEATDAVQAPVLFQA